MARTITAKARTVRSDRRVYANAVRDVIDEAQRNREAFHILTTGTAMLPLGEEEGDERAVARNIVTGVARLREALEQSVRLQRHYAQLLNDYDGGQRMLFDSAQAWLDRLAQTPAPEAIR